MIKMRYLLIGLILAVLNEILLAQSELPGSAHSGQYHKGMLGSIAQPSPIQQLPDTVYSVRTYPLYTPRLAPGKGNEVIQIYCRFCHSTIYITMQPPLPAAIWEAEVYKMINIYGAPIPEDAAKQITIYLQSHYTPETRKY